MAMRTDVSGSSGGWAVRPQGIEQVVQQVADAGAVQSGDRQRVAHAELVELERLRAQRLVVAAIDDQQDGGRLPAAQRALCAAQDGGDFVIGRRDAAGGVDQKEDGVGRADGLLGLGADLLDVVGRSRG